MKKETGTMMFNMAREMLADDIERRGTVIGGS
jgi:hypothetical protein